jgi:hypothetical protein
MSHLFSSFISLNRLPLRSRHASLFVVFSICAPIARNMEPKPETVQLITWSGWLNNNYFTSQRIFDTGALQSNYNLGVSHWKIDSGDFACPGITTVAVKANHEVSTVANNIMVWSTKFGGYASGLWPDHVKILHNPKFFTVFLKPFWQIWTWPDIWPPLPPSFPFKKWSHLVIFKLYAVSTVDSVSFNNLCTNNSGTRWVSQGCHCH